MRILILVALALLTAGQARASGSPIDLDPASLARKIFKRKPEPRDPVSRDVLIQQEREYRSRQAHRDEARPQTREQRMAEALERARSQGVGQ